MSLLEKQSIECINKWFIKQVRLKSLFKLSLLYCKSVLLNCSRLSKEMLLINSPQLQQMCGKRPQHRCQLLRTNTVRKTKKLFGLFAINVMKTPLRWYIQLVLRCNLKGCHIQKYISKCPYYAISKVHNLVLELSYNKFTCTQGQKAL